MQITDSRTLDASGLTRTKDGYLIGSARVSRAGNVQHYLGSELGLTGDDATGVFGVYRDPATVLDRESMASLAGRPVTRGHPPMGVSADSWRDLAVGHMGGSVARDGEHVVASMAIMDATAAAEIEAGARGLSAGYTVGLTRDEGVTEDGTAYQFRQTGPLRFNHVAYLPGNNPRAGNTRIGDADHWGTAPHTPTSKKEDLMSDALNTVVLGDQAVMVSADATAKIEAYKAAQAKALSDAEATHAKAIADKDAEIAKKDGEIADLQKQVLSADDLDRLVADRAALIDTAKRIAPKVELAGLADADIRKAVVTAIRGADATKDKSEAYIDAAFDILAEQKPEQRDTFRDAAKGGLKTVDADFGQAAYEKSLSDAWKAPMSKEAN